MSEIKMFIWDIASLMLFFKNISKPSRPIGLIDKQLELGGWNLDKFVLPIGFLDQKSFRHGIIGSNGFVM